MKYEEIGLLRRWSVGKFAFERSGPQQGIRRYLIDYWQGFLSAHWKVKLKYFLPSVFKEKRRYFVGINSPFHGVFWLSYGDRYE